MPSQRVLVTGAGGRTGTILTRKLLELGANSFIVRGMVRNAESEASLRASLGAELCKSLEVVIADITKPETLEAAFRDVQGVVITTGANPKVDKSSLPGVILAKVFTFGSVSKAPTFWFEDGHGPKIIDYQGQCNQIDAAKTADVKHVVLVSAMAGTKPDHFLNKSMDNIAMWKRKAECYLVASGLPYTIIHPGQMLPKFGDKNPALGFRRKLLVGVDDDLLEKGDESMMTREDLAEVCVQCLLYPEESKGRSFDIGSGPEQKKQQEVDLKQLISTLGGRSCKYLPAEATWEP